MPSATCQKPIKRTVSRAKIKEAGSSVGLQTPIIHMEMHFLSVKTIPTDEKNLHAATYYIGRSFKMTNVFWT